MRHREDELFLQRITHDLPKSAKTHLQLLDLKLKDAPIRLRCAVEDLCDTPVNPEDPAIEKIRKALTRESESGTSKPSSFRSPSAITSTTSPPSPPRYPSPSRSPAPSTKTSPTPPRTPASPPIFSPSAKT